MVKNQDVHIKLNLRKYQFWISCHTFSAVVFDASVAFTGYFILIFKECFQIDVQEGKKI